MPTIRPTADEFAAIRTAAKQVTTRTVHHVELGKRYGFKVDHAPSINLLQVDVTKDWEESDLDDFVSWADFRAAGIPSDDGRATVDFYVYSSEGLEGNCQAVFIGGRLVFVGVLGAGFGVTYWGDASYVDFDPATQLQAQPVQQQQARAAGTPAPDLNKPVTLPRIETKGGAVHFGTRFNMHRTPNYTGAGSHKFTASFLFDPADGSAWQGVIHVYQDTPDGAEYPRFETTIYRNGRMLPESNLPHLRAAAVAAYREAFPWSGLFDVTNWARTQHGLTLNRDAFGNWHFDTSVSRVTIGTGDYATAVAAIISGEAATVTVDSIAKAPVAHPQTIAENVGDHGVNEFDPDSEPEFTVAPPQPIFKDAAAYAREMTEALGSPAKAVAALPEAKALFRAPASFWAAVEAALMPPSAPRTLDLTPTWSGLLPALLAAYENGGTTGRQIAREELTRLARIADETNAEARAAAIPTPAARIAPLTHVPPVDLSAALPDSSALLGPRERGNPSDIFNMSEEEARAYAGAWSHIVPGLRAVPATEELGGPHTAAMGWGLTVTGASFLYVTRDSVAHALALAKAAPVVAVSPDNRHSGRPGVLPDCLTSGHVLGTDGHCRNCGMDLRGA